MSSRERSCSDDNCDVAKRCFEHACPLLMIHLVCCPALHFCGPQLNAAFSAPPKLSPLPALRRWSPRFHSPPSHRQLRSTPVSQARFFQLHKQRFAPNHSPAYAARCDPACFEPGSRSGRQEIHAGLSCPVHASESRTHFPRRAQRHRFTMTYCNTQVCCWLAIVGSWKAAVSSRGHSLFSASVPDSSFIAERWDKIAYLSYRYELSPIHTRIFSQPHAGSRDPVVLWSNPFFIAADGGKMNTGSGDVQVQQPR
jgi:hypothetical protein